LGDRLFAIQIGNEPAFFKHPDGRRYTFAEYLARWERHAQAIRAAVPGVAFAGPDVALDTGWVLQMADEEKNIAALTEHYYRGGAEDPSTSIADLLSGDAKFLGQVARIAAAADKRGVPFYLSEANSYYNGGKLGVSNTLASALWAGDFVLSCAQAGASGVQFHGGPLGALEVSLDRARNPALGEGDYKQRLDGISGRYTAIAGDASVGFYARPLYYGMLLAQPFAGARFIDTTLQDAKGINLTAYAAEQGERRVIAVFNKDLVRDVALRIALGRDVKFAQAWRLTGPASYNVHDVTLAGAEVDAHGAWAPKQIERLTVANAAVSLRVPRGSAALIQVE
jgi:hypothetical protein